jgi:hypothetical protein
VGVPWHPWHPRRPGPCEGITYLKSAATPFFWLAPISQRSELSIEVLHDLVSQGAAKLQAVKVGGQKKSWYFGFEATFFAILYSNRLGLGSIPGRGGLWGAAASQLLELQRPIAPFWKHLPHTILGLEAQGRGSTFRVRHALLKSAILLSIY